jgi:7-cyano-7-deazaguanine reductase
MPIRKTEENLVAAPLGKKSAYENKYNPTLLFPIPRKIKRDEIEIPAQLPFTGFDIWTAFEMSWLNPKGKPVVAVGEFRIPCESPNIIESKSFKLYLNSFNNSKFESFEQVAAIAKKDLSAAAGIEIQVEIAPLNKTGKTVSTLAGQCLDELDIECSEYQPNPTFLKTEPTPTEEILYSDLLKSNCLVTEQPDWGSIEIRYSGNKINHEGLLKYIVSLRDHNEFHEQCVERIFSDLLKNCAPKELTVYARYTRRGGLDINPFRTNSKLAPMIANTRLVRQ